MFILILSDRSARDLLIDRLKLFRLPTIPWKIGITHQSNVDLLPYPHSHMGQAGLSQRLRIVVSVSNFLSVLRGPCSGIEAKAKFLSRCPI